MHHRRGWDPLAARAFGARLTSAIGLFFILAGLVIAGVAVAEYVRPGLFDDGAPEGTAPALRDAVRGGAALVLGVIVWTVGCARSLGTERRAERAAARPAAQRDVVPGTNGVALEPAPPTLDGGPHGRLAEQIWRCRLGVDLQHQRLRQEGLGAESQIDAELYAMALRMLLRACHHAFAQTRSVRIDQAIERFKKVAPDHDLLALLERVDTYAPPGRTKKKIDDPGLDRPVGAGFTDEGTVLRLGDLRLRMTTLTAAAATLANTIVGELTNVRAIAKAAPRAKVAAPNGASDKARTTPS